MSRQHLRPAIDTETHPSMLERIPPVLRVLGVVVLLYVFLVSIKLMGGGFKHMGKDFSDALIRSAGNPFIGLFVGVLATSIVQSSSLTTSIVVAMVAAGTLKVPVAIPIVMGANIGTTVTNTIVSLGFVGRRRDFRRAFSCRTVHDFFNYLCVLLLLPMELLTRRVMGKGLLEWSAGSLASLFAGKGGSLKYTGPIKMALEPAAAAVAGAIKVAVSSKLLACWLQVILALALLFFALWAMTKLMRSLILAKLTSVVDRTIGRSTAVGVLVGVAFTAIVQSSSITTSILVPLAAAGVVDIRKVFPITVGANIGTTVTALLAALGGTPAGLQIALVHLLFNMTGMLIFLPLERLRQVPIRLANNLAGLTMRSRWYAVAYVGIFFFAVPALLVFLA